MFLPIVPTVSLPLCPSLSLSMSLALSVEDNQPYLTVPCAESKITSAVWGPLGELVIAGHENGEINQFSAKVHTPVYTHFWNTEGR